MHLLQIGCRVKPDFNPTSDSIMNHGSIQWYNRSSPQMGYLRRLKLKANEKTPKAGPPQSPPSESIEALTLTLF